MKKLFLVFFTFFICFMKSQDIVSIIKNNPSKRTDLKILLNKENPHHYIPISVINGKEKGPVFTILAGVHGCFPRERKRHHHGADSKLHHQKHHPYFRCFYGYSRRRCQ